MNARSIGVKERSSDRGTYTVLLELKIAHFVHKQSFVCGMEEGHGSEPICSAERTAIDEEASEQQARRRKITRT